MLYTINEYRKKYGKSPVIIDNLQNDCCTQHCWAMVRNDSIYHTEDCYLEDWSEIVVSCNQLQQWKDVENYLIDIIDNSEEHRNLLLNAKKIGYGIIAFKGKVYLTIRCKND